MAIAVAMMFNIDLPQNFNSPYKALSISDFWKRWHMTLTGFLTRYVYIPLGGSRKGIVRTCVNIMIVYLVSGIWHGTGITFLLWGTLHGAAMIVHRLFRDSYDRFPKIIRWLATFLFINVTWVFFRAGSVSEAVDMLRQVFVGGWEFYINPELTETLLQPTLISAASRFLTLPVVAVAGVAVSIFVATRMDNSMQMTERFKPGAASWIVTYIMLVLSILSLSGVSTFLYTNF
jgi:D-alanyl-lipoteichoic acid acyltransferase DltB (MBOAT superfamily)